MVVSEMLLATLLDKKRSGSVAALRILWGFVWLLLAWGYSGPVFAAEGLEPSPIRVGVVAFEDFEGEFQRWNRVFTQLQQQHKSSLSFELAVGTYGDLLHWMDQGFVDMAVLTPGVFAEYFQLGEQDKAISRTHQFEYLATDGLPAATSKWASEARRQAGFHLRYHSLCAVASDSSFKTFDDVLGAIKKNQVEVLFVNPLSVSGRVLPEYVLRQNHVKLSAGQVRYTYSHTESLRLLAQANEGKERVAFVWDDALKAKPELENTVRKVPGRMLEELSIPHNVIVMKSDHPSLAVVRRWFASFRDEEGVTETRYMKDWKKHYPEVSLWYQGLPTMAEDHLAQPVSLDEIGQILLHSARSQPTPPRLAVVLSGGGAKCSYQVGAICALEEQLAELRKQNPGLPLDIDLVVGTSGGAINAVPIAFGVTSTAAGRQEFQEVWESLDQRDVVVPSWPVRVNIGLWFALVEAGLLLWIVKRLVRNPEQRPAFFSGSLIGLAGFHAAAAYLHYAPWEWLGSYHLLHHAWLWLAFGTETMCWCLFGLGIVCWLVHKKKIKKSRYLSITKRQVIWALTVCLLGLPIIQIVTVLCLQTTLSGGSGIEHAIAQKLPRLISSHFKRAEKSRLNLDENLTNPERLRTASRQLIEGNQLERDLVITANCIEKTDKSLPTDLYFFVGAEEKTSSPFQQRGISFADHPSVLLDVVIGSGTIFPVFPSRKLADFPRKNESVELIDGGFAHNSPVEAAVLWGATHIVLVEATPQRVSKRKNFLYNAATAFAHLHKQTQLVDARSKQQVVVFTLQPSPPHLCVLDFASNLIRASIDRGYRDAQGKSEASTRKQAATSQFYKELGAPVFTRVDVRGRP